MKAVDKRYLLFGGYRDKPLGGWEDFRGSFNYVNEAREEAERFYDWWEIVDMHSERIIYTESRAWERTSNS